MGMKKRIAVILASHGEAETGGGVVPVDPAPEFPEVPQAGGIRLTLGVATLAAGRVEDFWPIEPEMLEEVLGMIGRGTQEPAVPWNAPQCSGRPRSHRPEARRGSAGSMPSPRT